VPAPEQGQSLASLIDADSRRRRLGALLGWLTDLPWIGGPIARVMRAPNRFRSASTRVTRTHAWLLRRTGGRLRRSWLFAAGQPVLSLTTVGRRSGRLRSTAVACFAHGEELALAGMNLGLSRNPAWSFNLEANPDATIELGGETVPVHARRARDAEAEALWHRWVELQPSATAMRELSHRDIPLFVLSRRAEEPLCPEPGGARS
jgi:F420H(2)-dependent quinone reductase